MWVYSATYMATQADINAGTDLVNTASVVTTEVPGPTTDDATTTITQGPSLTIMKDVDLTNISAPGLVDLYDHGDQYGQCRFDWCGSYR